MSVLSESTRWRINRTRRNLFGERCSKTIPTSWEDQPGRTDLIQRIIDLNNYQSYLEIGCSTDHNFSQIRCNRKVGVDPVKGGTVRKTSDDFFADNNDFFDCIFIDGLHEHKQVVRDIDNALDILTDEGIIFLHDCMPGTIEMQAVPREQADWNGDVWKAFVECRTKMAVDSAVCLIDQGVGVIKKRNNTSPPENLPRRFAKKLLFCDLADNYEEWLRPIQYPDIFDFIAGKVTK